MNEIHGFDQCRLQIVVGMPLQFPEKNFRTKSFQNYSIWALLPYVCLRKECNFLKYIHIWSAVE